MMKSIRAALAFAVLGLAIVLPGRQGVGQNVPAWQSEIVRDIMAAKKCEVDFLSHVIERRIEGLQVVMAKVHCQDQRAFDAIRRGEKAAFEYRECEKRDEATC